MPRAIRVVYYNAANTEQTLFGVCACVCPCVHACMLMAARAHGQMSPKIALYLMFIFLYAWRGVCAHMSKCVCVYMSCSVCVLCGWRLTVRSSWVTLHLMYWFRVSYLNSKLASWACLDRQLALEVPCLHFPCIGIKDQYWGPCSWLRARTDMHQSKG